MGSRASAVYRPAAAVRARPGQWCPERCPDSPRVPQGPGQAPASPRDSCAHAAVSGDSVLCWDHSSSRQTHTQIKRHPPARVPGSKCPGWQSNCRGRRSQAGTVCSGHLCPGEARRDVPPHHIRAALSSSPGTLHGPSPRPGCLRGPHPGDSSRASPAPAPRGTGAPATWACLLGGHGPRRLVEAAGLSASTAESAWPTAQTAGTLSPAAAFGKRSPKNIWKRKPDGAL